MKNFITNFIPNQKKKQPQTNSVYDLLGIQKVENDIIIADTGYTMILEVLPVNFRLKSLAEQEYIINCYEEFLKILKQPMEVFSIALKANVTKHIEYMEEFEKSTLDENKAIAIQEYIEFVKTEAKRSAVSRRFFLALSCPLENNLNGKIDIEKAQDILGNVKEKTVQALQKCEVIVIERDRQENVKFIYEVLYYLLNRVVAEKQPLPFNNNFV